MKNNHDLIPCTTLFSNGTEFEWFIECNCEKGCTRYRKDKCRVLNACYEAMWDHSKFPYNSLLDYAEGYAGKICKLYTDVPIKRKRKEHNCQGQLTMFE